MPVAVVGRWPRGDSQKGSPTAPGRKGAGWEAPVESDTGSCRKEACQEEDEELLVQ